MLLSTTMPNSNESALSVRELLMCMHMLMIMHMILCTEHRCCYTLINVAQHLQKQHHIIHQQKMWILDVLHSADLAFTINEVIRLISEFSVILNLSVHNDYQCLHCNFCSTNADSIRQHCKCTHKKEVLRKLRWEKGRSHDDLLINTNEENPPLPYCAVKLQTL